MTHSDGILAAQNAFQFSSKYLDKESGLSYYGFRYYDAENGRWISRDPIEERGGLNIYGFVRSRPVVALDPLGLKEYYVVLPLGDSMTVKLNPAKVGYWHKLKFVLGLASGGPDYEFFWPVIAVGAGSSSPQWDGARSGWRISDLAPKIQNTISFDEQTYIPPDSPGYDCPSGMIIIYWIGANDVGRKVAQAGSTALSPAQVESKANAIYGPWRVHGPIAIYQKRKAFKPKRRTLFIGITMPRVTDEWSSDATRVANHRLISRRLNLKMWSWMSAQMNPSPWWTTLRYTVWPNPPDSGDGLHYASTGAQTQAIALWNIIDYWLSSL